ncbi:hypothetical protein POSPLADRAFT_1077635, partial [Postia placenta MAD-698-R-SB12]
PGSPSSTRPLNVTDALGYLDSVKAQFQDKPDVYNHFLDIMKDFKSQVIDTPGVIARVSMLFHSNPYLIQGFNTFLPPGYRIDVSTDPQNPGMITVTTPTSVDVQHISAFGGPMRIPHDHVPPRSINLAPFPQPPPFSLAPPPVLPVGIGNGSRPATPSRTHPPPDYTFSPSIMFALPAAGPQAVSAASFLGNLGNRTNEGIATTGEFNHAIQFLNKIKMRFEEDPETYKQFLEILHAYQKQPQDSQVYAQVQTLFKDAPDLVNEFRDFLPEAIGPSSQHLGLVGILPHPAGGAGAWAQAEPPAPSAEKVTKAPTRRRKRPAEKEAAGAPKAAGGRAAKRTKPNQKSEPQSPKFSSYPVPASPPPQHPHPAMGVPPHPQLNHPHMFPPPPTPNGQAHSLATPDELLLFDRIKKALESGGTYEEFLKLLTLYAKDVIDTKTLIDRAEIFLGDGELMAQFKDLTGWDDNHGNVEYGPPGSIRTGPPDPYGAKFVEDGHGPSYRWQVASEKYLACSGRGRLEWSVLNDEWVSHPTWASEDSGFAAHKKNQYEDILNKIEEDRHEYQTYLDALGCFIVVLKSIEARLDEMTAEERANFRLGPNLGGRSPGLYRRMLKKIYGLDGTKEILKALQESPAAAVPVVLKRLKLKDDDWRHSLRDWNSTEWRPGETKNFYKALDHQGIVFKANDKKCITAKHFVQDIEGAKASLVKEREAKGEQPWYHGSVGPALEFELQDTGVIQDALKLIFSFLDHSPSTYSTAERRSMERFLRQFIPALLMFSSHEFNAACGPLEPGHEDDLADDSSAAVDGTEDQRSGRDRCGRRQASGGHSTGVSPGDLRKRLLKTAQESKSAGMTRSNSPAPSDSASTSAKHRGSKLNQELDVEDEGAVRAHDIWIQDAVDEQGNAAGDTPTTRRPFFANTTFYTLLRLLQLLYSRLFMCKEIGAQLAAQKHASLLANPVAVDVGLDEPNGPPTVLAQIIEAFGESRSGEEPNVLYLYLLDACEKLFDSEMDQATFEEHMRWFFSTKAYHLFTLDRVIIAIVKQVQTIMSDNKCQELWDLLQQARGAETITIHDTVRYRREAERHVGYDDNLYRFDWDGEAKRLTVQLVGSSDPSVEEDVNGGGRLKEYVATYVMERPTEWQPAGRRKSGSLFLKRCVAAISGYAGEKGEVVERSAGMRVAVQGSYKLLYESGREDGLWRRRGVAETASLARRAGQRQEE